MNIVLYQPDIPQNTGTILRLGAALGLAVHIVEPCGFMLSDRRLKRAALDYMPFATIHRHASWEAFLEARAGQGRLVLASTQAAVPYTKFNFSGGDWLIMGRESAGVPVELHQLADARVLIPMQSGVRSLNVAVAAAMIAGEAMRQTTWNPM